MNGMTLPTMPLGTSILLPMSQPLTAGVAVGALPFSLPDIVDPALPAPSDVQETEPVEDTAPALNAMDAELLLQLAGFSAPAIAVHAAPPPPVSQVAAPVPATPPAPVTPTATTVAMPNAAPAAAPALPITDELPLTSNVDEAVAGSPTQRPATSPAAAAPVVYPAPDMPETVVVTLAPAKQSAETDTPSELPAAAVSVAATAALAEVDKHAMTRPLPKHAPHREPFVRGIVLAKPMLREAVGQSVAGATITQGQQNIISVSSAIFDPGAVASRAPDPIAVPAQQPAIIDRQLDLAREDLWLGELARDIVAFGDRTEGLSFRLMPRALGQLDVNIASSDKGLSIRMAASSEDARSIVAAAQPRLVDEIRSQGVRVADASVGHGSAGDGRSGRGAETWPSLIEIAHLPIDPEPASAPDKAARGLFA